MGAAEIQQDAVYLYGSARLGELSVKRAASQQNSHFLRFKGNRHYELTNHLGNVLAVVTDRKLARDTTANADYAPQFYLPDIFMVSNYYAFGQPMPKWFSKAADAPIYDPTKYRFGFNGKEDDDEWSKQDYGFRIYDPRGARFLSVDPLTQSYPWYTPYQFAGNMPIWANDLDGLEPDYQGSDVGEEASAPAKGHESQGNQNWCWNGNGHGWLRIDPSNTIITAQESHAGQQWKEYIGGLGEVGFEAFKNFMFNYKVSVMEEGSMAGQTH